MIRWFLIIGFWLLCLFLGFFLGYGTNADNLRREEEKKITNYLNDIRKVFKMNTLEVSGFAKLEHSEKSDNPLSFITNSLFAKDYFIQIPYRAKYGFDMESPDFQLNYKSDTIYARIPSCTLLSFELEYSKQNVILKEGWFVQADDKKLEPFEKKLYLNHKKLLAEDQKLLYKSKEHAIQALKILLEPLGKPVILL